MASSKQAAPNRWALWVLAWMLAACGTGPGQAEPKPVKPNLLKRMEEIDRRFAPPSAAVAPPTAAARPYGLRRGDGLRLDLGRARYIERPGDTPQQRSLADFVAGQRGAVFALWATWCKPCIAPEELVRLRRIRARLPEDFPLISMACDGVGLVQDHPRAQEWVHPVWQVDDGHIALLPQAFIQVNGLGLPVFLITGPQGEVRWYRTRDLDDEAVEEILAAVQSGR